MFVTGLVAIAAFWVMAVGFPVLYVKLYYEKLKVAELETRLVEAELKVSNCSQRADRVQSSLDFSQTNTKLLNEYYKRNRPKPLPAGQLNVDNLFK